MFRAVFVAYLSDILWY